MLEAIKKLKYMRVNRNQVIKQVELKKKITELEKEKVRLGKEIDAAHKFSRLSAEDLKTPIRGITFIAEWLQGEYGQKLDPQGKKYLKLLQMF